MSISSNDLRPGVTIEWDGGLWRVLEFLHVKPGKGAAFVRAKLKNIRTGAVRETTFRAGEKMERARVETRKMQYLYTDGEYYTFMDNESFEQLQVPASMLEDEVKYLLENMECQVMIYEEQAIGVELPNTVVLTVAETEPGIKGDTAQGGSKNATMETGAVVHVPLFIEQGEKLIIDTRSGNYVSRA
ncbi:elongation factor P [Tumebacillus permanentifrigoris]|uniref:Elongation factor P n=1 Tax=Tumebacillus permanentifrigoris TaxID=378543 RepID=A0A316DQY9_9BACL|nr:elongation factor P [Tumebacillus permanentifrigoris]PWK06307.1 translation elongation factor P (EF-P) [Tumebacillus permanentifrigoris]